MNACLISVLPMKQAMTSPSIVGDYLALLLGTRAAQWISILILWTAFASIFSLMLGYSRILYAAARDGNFFGLFAQAARHRGVSVRVDPLPRLRGRGLLLAVAEERAAGDPLDPRDHPVHGPDHRRGDPAPARAAIARARSACGSTRSRRSSPSASGATSCVAEKGLEGRRPLRDRGGAALLLRARVRY